MSNISRFHELAGICEVTHLSYSLDAKLIHDIDVEIFALQYERNALLAKIEKAKETINEIHQLSEAQIDEPNPKLVNRLYGIWNKSYEALQQLEDK